MASVETVLTDEPARQLGIGQRREEPHHRDRDRCLLDEICHRLGDRSCFAIETEDEAGGDQHPGVVDFLHTIGQTATGILFLLHRHECVGIRALDPDEYREKAADPHFLFRSNIANIIRGLSRNCLSAILAMVTAATVS
jgi:hypothetical protein